MRTVKKRVPREEVGTWVDHQVGDKSQGVRRWNGCTATFGAEEILLKANNRIVARSPRENPPLAPWGTPCDEALAFSGDGRWLWHLGYEQGQPQLALLTGDTLRRLDTFHPITVDFAEMRDVPLTDWCELAVVVSDVVPDVLLAFGNGGDSFVFLYTLEATPKGIVDRVGNKLYCAVADRLDERIQDAAFIAPNRFLILDDIGILTLFSWPAAKPLLTYSLEAGFRDDPDADYFPIWPTDDASTRFSFDSIVARVGESVLIEVTKVTGGGNTIDMHALVVLNAATLAPQGLVRPPKTPVTRFLHLGGDRFGMPTAGGKLHSWKLALQ